MVDVDISVYVFGWINYLNTKCVLIPYCSLVVWAGRGPLKEDEEKKQKKAKKKQKKKQKKNMLQCAQLNKIVKKIKVDH